MDLLEFDFLVIGSGIAGLTYALEMAECGSVALVTKKQAAESATNFAQGGMAAVVSSEDSIEAHVRDTLDAGSGLCREEVVRFVVERGPAAAEGLVRRGVVFDRQAAGASYDLTREGGHSRRRVLHNRDATGREIERALLRAARAHARIELFENHCAVDLLTTRKAGLAGSNRCLGAYVLDADTGEVVRFIARLTFLATGGAGKVYRYTSNPDIASGDGMAMAFRAGATLANMEFMQFHPTCLHHPRAKSFLISEALRGEGGTLRTLDGQAFMTRYDERGDLAPRDIVARAIDEELKRSGNDCVSLDMTGLEASFVSERFPTIHERCLSFGIDMTKGPIPVVPAAHYLCGGVLTDLRGETDLENLFAAGEVACTGLHGANRLASNSLLEGVVFALAAAEEGRVRFRDVKLPDGHVPPWLEGDAREPSEAVIISQNWDEIRRLMWNYVGIVRTDKRLMRARRRIELLHEEINEYYWDFRVTPDLIELRNLATVADLIIRCAIRRKESRGLHYTLDYPERDSRFARDTLAT